MNRSFLGNSGNWTDSASWTPDGAPVAGDTLTIAAGNALIAGETVDAETLLLGSTDPARPATLSLSNATLGPAFLQRDNGAGSSATLSLSGQVTLAGTMIEAAQNGTTLIDLAPAGAPAATAVLSGSLTVANGDHATIQNGTFDDEGTITVDGGTLAIGSSLKADATIVIEHGGTLELSGVVPRGLTVEFADGTGTLILDKSQYFAGAVTGFQNGDSIVFAQTLARNFDYSSQAIGLFSGMDGNTQGAEIAYFPLTGPGGLTNNSFFLSQDGQGNSVLFYSVARNWTGTTGNWFNAANWTTGSGATGIPGDGDTATITAGTARMTTSASNALNNQTIKLSNTGGLEIEGGILGPLLTIKGDTRNQAVLSNPTLTLDGQTTLDGKIVAAGPNVTLKIDIAPGLDGSAGTLTVNSDGLVSVDYSSGGQTEIDLHQGHMTDNGLIQVHGLFDVGTAATLDGNGTVEVTGGTLLVKGTVGSSVHVDLSGGANTDDPDTGHNRIEIAQSAHFAGVIDNFSGNDRIDLMNVQAASESFDQASNTLSLFDQNDNTVATLTLSGVYTSDDFTLAGDGHNGTRITETSSAQPLDNVTSTTLPIPILLSTGNTESLQQILTAAFGPTVGALYDQALIESSSPSDMTWAAYWNLAHPSVSHWSIDGAAVPADTYRLVNASDWSTTLLTAGNAIETTAQVLLPATWNNGIVTSYTSYDIELVDPALFSPPTAPPTPAAIVAAAQTFNSVYANTPNSEDCYNIAAQVAAAAGATFGVSMFNSDPTQNAASGFWRIAYAAPQDGSAIANWSGMVRAGDILRIGWMDDSQDNPNNPGSDAPHSFTVLSGLQNGTISVFDNALQPDDLSSQAEAQIGIHAVNYWTQTDPQAITIFRLDPNDQFLITGSLLQKADAKSGEELLGNGWNDLFIPGATGDTVVFGSGTDVLADIGANLDGATLRNLQNGDSIDITDMNAATARVGYDAVNGLLTLASGEQTVTIKTARGLTGTFSLSADGGRAGLDGGTLGSLYDVLYDGDALGTRVAFTASAPATPILAAADGAPIDPDALTLSGSGDAGTTISVSAGNTVIATTTVSSANQWSVTLPTALPTGSTTLQLVETNGQGASSAAATLLATRASDAISLRRTDPSGAIVTDAYDGKGNPSGWTTQSTSTADGTTTLQHYAANGALAETTISNAQGLVLEDRTPAQTTLYGYDGAGTLTATASTAAFVPAASISNSRLGAVLVTADSSHAAVNLLSGNNVVMAHSGDTISAGTGSDTITALSNGVSVTGGSGMLHFIDSGASTVSGGTGSETIFGAAGGQYTGGSRGENVMQGAGASTLIGGGGGDTLTGGNGDLMFAARGNSTLSGSQNTVMVDNDGTTAFTGNNATVFGANAGSDVVVGTGRFTEVGRDGQTTVFGGASAGTTWAGLSHLVDVAGTGTGTLVVGQAESALWINEVAGKQSVMAVNGAGGGSMTVIGFRAGTDSFSTSGYGADAVKTVNNGTLTLTLSDHTSITFLGVASLT